MELRHEWSWRREIMLNEEQGASVNHTSQVAIQKKEMRVAALTFYHLALRSKETSLSIGDV